MANPVYTGGFSIAGTPKEFKMNPDDEYNDPYDDEPYSTYDDGYGGSYNDYGKPYKKKSSAKSKSNSNSNSKKKTIVISQGKGKMIIPKELLEKLRNDGIDYTKPVVAKPAVAVVSNNCPACNTVLTSRLCAPYCPKCNKVNVCHEYTGMPTGNWVTPL